MQEDLSYWMYVYSICNDMGTARILLQEPIILWAAQDKADLRTGWDCVSGAPEPWCVLHSVWWRGAVVPWLRSSGPQVMATFRVFCHLLQNHTEVYVKEFRSKFIPNSGISYSYGRQGNIKKEINVRIIWLLYIYIIIIKYMLIKFPCSRSGQRNLCHVSAVSTDRQ
jgi:hypothetical protein